MDQSKFMYKGKINLNYTTLFNTGYFIGTDLYTVIHPSLERFLVNDLLLTNECHMAHFIPAQLYFIITGFILTPSSQDD